MEPDTLLYLVDYNVWADHKVLDAARQLTPAQLHESHHMGVGPMFDTLVHIMEAQRLWLTRMQGTSPRSMAPASNYQDLDQLRAAWDAVHRDLRAFVAGLNTEQLNGTITYTNTRGDSYSHPLLLLILHVFNHSTEHRAQVAAMCAQVGLDVGWLDLIQYMRTPGTASR